MNEEEAITNGEAITQLSRRVGPEVRPDEFFPPPTGGGHDACAASGGIPAIRHPEVGPAFRPSGDGLIFRSEGHGGGPASDLCVLGVAPDAGACGHYRVTYPLRTLADQGAAVEVYEASAPVPRQALLRADAICVSRAHTEGSLRRLLAVRQLTGAALVYGLDDCLHAVAPDSPAFAAYDPATPAGRATLDGVRAFLRETDGALFSTRELAAFYGDDTPYAHVLFNGLDLTLGERDWDPHGPPYDWRALAAGQGCAVDEGSLLFGWAGSATHLGDLLEMGDAVARVLAQTRNTVFGICTDPYLARHLCVERWGLPLSRVVLLPTAPFRDYPRRLSAFDVALAPLTNTVFNRCKSSLKLLEHGAWGTPYVASRVAPYWRLHVETEGRGGLIAADPDEFTAHTVRLLGDAGERRERGAFLQGYVREHHDVRVTMAALPETLRAIRAGRRTPLHRPPVQALEDARRGVPKVGSPGHPADGPCPCGSGTTYARCPRGCAPAFGPL